MLDHLSLVHMNGRMYDSAIARFLSADPFLTEPLNTQNFNRYSYVDNQPLTYIDPSGFSKSEQTRRGLLCRDFCSTVLSGALHGVLSSTSFGRVGSNGESSRGRRIIRPAASPIYVGTGEIPVGGPVKMSGCSRWAVSVGNWFQEFAMGTSDASKVWIGTGTAIAIGSASRGSVVGFEVGVATVLTGGVAGEIAAVAQAAGGLFHGFGGAGWNNATNGTLMFFGGQAVKAILSPARGPIRTVREHAEANLGELTKASGGVLYDTLTSLDLGLEPELKTCGEN